jgi:hypothetical protein
VKDNTAESKQLLKRALANLPQDNILREVHFHIRQALTKIEQVEAKRNKKEAGPTQAQQWNQMLQTNTQNPYNTNQTLNAIEQMIAEEKANLEAIQARRALRQQRPNQDGDSGSETLFG